MSEPSGKTPENPVDRELFKSRQDYWAAISRAAVWRGGGVAGLTGAVFAGVAGAGVATGSPWVVLPAGFASSIALALSTLANQEAGRATVSAEQGFPTDRPKHPLRATLQRGGSRRSKKK